MSSTIEPTICFFLLGLFAGFVRSNLEIPQAISKFLALYLLMALGLKGGFALAASGLNQDILWSLGVSLLLATVIPIISFVILRKWTNHFDALAIAATYGSVSAVTFITATQFLDGNGILYSGHMAASLAIMETPAIILAVLMATYLRKKIKNNSHQNINDKTTVSHVLKEALTDGAQLILLGSLIIGVITGVKGEMVMQPFFGNLFKGMLAIFLLDMGLMAARNMPPIRDINSRILLFAVVMPVIFAAMAFALTRTIGMSHGDQILFMILAASASYIAVPAVLRESVPEANAALYFGLALGITFPINIIVAIPLYTKWVQWY